MSRRKLILHFLFFLSAFSFSSWLMFSTFSYDNGNLIMSSKVWSDFAATIPLIRSFSLGENFPPQYPLFPGPFINYHFLFYLLVGLLEKAGLRIDIALNSLSVIGFSSLLVLIFYFAKTVFKSVVTGILSVAFFLFNGSFSFFYLFDKNDTFGTVLGKILTSEEFLSFAPYGDGIVTAFWNLNIYTNQRHLPLSFFISLLMIFVFLLPVFSKKIFPRYIYILLGLLLSLSFFLHFAVFLSTCVVLFFLSILFEKQRLNGAILLVTAFFLSLPQYLFLRSGNDGFSIIFEPGYLLSQNLGVYKFFEFWISNLGLHFFLIPLGWFFSNKKQKKVLLSFIPLFLIGNLFRFSPEMAGNHKFFNYFMLSGVMFSAFSLVVLWKRKIIFKILVILLFPFLIFSGIVDFFPIINDDKFLIRDAGTDETVTFIKNQTPKDAVFLNTTFIYDPASLAGRNIFLGWPYFAWSAGYDTDGRLAEMSYMLESTDKNILCQELEENNISYVSVKENFQDSNLPPASDIFENEFVADFSNLEFTIYNVMKTCENT